MMYILANLINPSKGLWFNLHNMEAAAVAKEIFRIASQKTGINEIVRRLNAAGIPPINDAITYGFEGNYNKGNGLWNSRTVKDILTNRAYVGDLEQGRENYLVQNTHEPLVRLDMFDAVQKSIVVNTAGDSSKTNTPRQDNVLRGKVICGCCGGKMQRRKGSGNADWHFLTCISNNRLGVGHCTGMYIRELDIMNAILREVRIFVQIDTTSVSTYKNEVAVIDGQSETVRWRN